MPHAHSLAPERQRPGFTLAILSLSALAYILLQSMVVPALPELATSLDTNASGIAWVLTAYLLSASVATPVLGRMGDMFGKKRVLVFVLAALVCGSIVAALTTTLAVMIVARVIQGAGGAVFPLAFSIIRDEFPREHVAGAIGLLSALIGIGSGAAIVIAGPIVEHLSIHWLFWLPGIMAGIATVGTVLWIPESPVRAPGRINYLAAATLSAWLVALLLGVSHGRDWGWTSPGVLSLMVGAVVAFAAWIAVELRSQTPLVDVRMMRIPTVWWTNVSATLFGFGMYSIMVAVPAYLQTPTTAGYGFGASVARSGLVLLPMSGAMLVAGIATGAMTARYGAKLPLVLGAFTSAVGVGFLAFQHAQEWTFYVAMTIVGVGIGFAFSAMSNLVIEAVPAHQTGVATGMNANVRTIGGSIGSQVVASIIVSGVAAGALPLAHSYAVAFAVIGAVLAVAGLAALLVPGTAARRSAAPAADPEAHEFDIMSTDPSAVSASEAGVAIAELRH